RLSGGLATWEANWRFAGMSQRRVLGVIIQQAVASKPKNPHVILYLDALANNPDWMQLAKVQSVGPL
ncbi:MAG: hypothetical protein ACK8QZ_11585, partial [Anaerolineales bacterium]